MKKYLVGIDVGFANMGLLIFEVPEMELIRFKVISTEAQNKKRGIRKLDDDMERVKQLVKGLEYFAYDTNAKIMMTAEMPHGGAKSSRAARAMGISSAVTMSFATLFDIPIEFVDPLEAKRALVGNGNATKEEMMFAACDKLQIEIEEKISYREIKGKAKKVVYRSYLLNGESINEGRFEHLADAYGAVLHTVNNSEMYKVFVA